MGTDEFWNIMESELKTPFAIKDVVSIEEDRGTTWIETADGKTYHVQIQQCDTNHEHLIEVYG